MMTEASTWHFLSTGEAYQSMRLTTPLLNGVNYPSWARSISLCLQGKSKLPHILGTDKLQQILEPQNSTDSTVLEGEKSVKKPTKTSTAPVTDQNWEQNDINVMNCLLNSMEPQISKLFMYCDTTQEILNEIKEMFDQEHKFAYIFQLKQKILQIRQGSRSVTEYYGDLKTKWDELTLYQ
jgi:gag-polypeptide of LTR copia-type/Retrotransposon gag protein